MAPDACAPAEAAPSTSGRGEDAPSARMQFVLDMRRRFSPRGMVNEDGSINQDFFKPRRVVLVQGAALGAKAKWGAGERAALLRGLEVHGVGKWREIARDFLPGGHWDDTAIRVRAARLLGSQSLARYVGWRGNADKVAAEYARNKAIGLATGCWKGGVLVEDTSGSVRKYLEQQQQGVQGQAH